jgi:propanol-preferring alcohol dehydrogenase
MSQSHESVSSARTKPGANLTRSDGEAFFPLAAAAGVRTETLCHPLAEANAALDNLRAGRLQGAAVLVP